MSQSLGTVGWGQNESDLKMLLHVQLSCLVKRDIEVQETRYTYRRLNLDEHATIPRTRPSADSRSRCITNRERWYRTLMQFILTIYETRQVATFCPSSCRVTVLD